ncbi:hypothetical protein MCOR29_001071 [Pyricularia oryzae]|nr:hypothetical protein MCOR01_001902 [Pyricularia oryzae]KAI6253072.1 hypothetical protein MCOR19_010344 [Pyricularia oryzae]KAI6333503.1 hypothetical protein MCOR29_001071 [Pyricularia oryzae]KAI6359957.1 hypothetical protein MCOR31_009270 [Pyricularia oryzae]KAI6413132.1 hypothetical protein MCOR24_006567 [Pyricularia oryzae]
MAANNNNNVAGNGQFHEQPAQGGHGGGHRGGGVNHGHHGAPPPDQAGEAGPAAMQRLLRQVQADFEQRMTDERRETERRMQDLQRDFEERIRGLTNNPNSSSDNMTGNGQLDERAAPAPVAEGQATTPVRDQVELLQQRRLQDASHHRRRLSLANEFGRQLFAFFEQMHETVPTRPQESLAAPAAPNASDGLGTQ